MDYLEPTTETSGNSWFRLGRWQILSSAAIGLALSSAILLVSGTGPFGSQQADAVDTPTTDAVEMPSELESLAARVYPTFAATSRTELVARASDFTQLPAKDFARASLFYVDYFSPGREMRLYTGLEGDAPSRDSVCPEPLASHVMSCEVIADTDNAFTVASVNVAINRNGPDLELWKYVAWRDLPVEELKLVRFERAVTTYWKDGRTVTAREQVFAPSTLDPGSEFVVPVKALAELATEPNLRLS